MTKQIEHALALLANDDVHKHFDGICRLLEILQNSPQDLDPVARALLESVCKPLIAKVEEKLETPNLIKPTPKNARQEPDTTIFEKLFDKAAGHS